MNHERASLLLPDYLQGRLGAGDREAVAAHVESCADCAALAHTHRLLAEALVESAAAAEPVHPGSDELVAYALEAQGLPTEDLARIGAHLERCDPCREAVQATREAEASLAGGRRSWTAGLKGLLAFLGTHLGMICAGMLALLLVGGAVILPLYWLPRMNAVIGELRSENRRLGAEIAALREGAERAAAAVAAVEWSGPIRLPVFEGPRRGAEAERRVELRQGQPFVPMVVVPPSLGDLPDTESLHLEIREDSGRVAWDYFLTAREARAEVAAASVLTFSIPASRLEHGSYVLVLAPAAGSGSPLLLLPFDVVPTR